MVENANLALTWVITLRSVDIAIQAAVKTIVRDEWMVVDVPNIPFSSQYMVGWLVCPGLMFGSIFMIFARELWLVSRSFHYVPCQLSKSRRLSSVMLHLGKEDSAESNLNHLMSEKKKHWRESVVTKTGVFHFWLVWLRTVLRNEALRPFHFIMLLRVV